jgi:hypothetical protein
MAGDLDRSTRGNSRLQPRCRHGHASSRHTRTSRPRQLLLIVLNRFFITKGRLMFRISRLVLLCPIALALTNVAPAVAADKYQIIPLFEYIDQQDLRLRARALLIDTTSGQTPLRCQVSFQSEAFQFDDGTAKCIHDDLKTGTMPPGPGSINSVQQRMGDWTVLWKVDQSSGDVTACINDAVPDPHGGTVNPWWCSPVMKRP